MEFERVYNYLFWPSNVGLVKTRKARYNSWGVHLSDIVRFSIHTSPATSQQQRSLPDDLYERKQPMNWAKYRRDTIYPKTHKLILHLSMMGGLSFRHFFYNKLYVRVKKELFSIMAVFEVMSQLCPAFFQC